MAKGKLTDWSEHGQTVLEMYRNGSTVSKIVDYLTSNGMPVRQNVVYGYLHRNGVKRVWNYDLAECRHCKNEFKMIGSRHWYCKICVPDLESGQRMLKYGMSKPEFDALLASQNGTCALCEKTENLCVDHCHSTGRVRGFLCYQCNIAMGSFDKAGWVDRAKQYSSGNHDDLLPGTFTPEALSSMKALGDRAAKIHDFLEWSHDTGMRCCFGSVDLP